MSGQGSHSRMSHGAHHLLVLQKMHMLSFDVWQTEYINYFEPFMPPDWHVTAVEQNCVPFGRMVVPPEQPGIMMTFTGRSLVALAHAHTKGREAFSIWIMPHVYTGKADPNIMKWASEHLGDLPTHAVYVYQLSKTTPTWPDWKKELKKILKLTPPPTETSK